MTLALSLLLACTSDPPASELPFEARPASAAALERAFPADRIKAQADRAGWAADLAAVFAQDKIPQTNGNVCAAVATVEQESGYDADPSVPGLGDMIDTWIEEKQAEMSTLPAWAFGAGLRKVLDVTPPGETTSFYARLHSAKTERDVDQTYRDFLAHYRSKLPEPLKAAEAAASVVGYSLDTFNPITTSGCMQVKVDYAEDHARSHGLAKEGVRDALYTRAGCLHYGVHRLLGWEASYDALKYRFADYNAGFFSSRNAAFQEQLAAVWGKPLALDGDLLRYDRRGNPDDTPSQTLTAVLEVMARLPEAERLSERQVRRDLAKEKEASFERTDTWGLIRALYQKKSSREPSYARLPIVKLDSIKLSGDKTTEWFATSVDKRYQRCLARLK